MADTHRSTFNTRQYMLSRDFEIYYYSDLHFTSVGKHSHDYYEFYFFVEGSVDMEIAGVRHPLSPGDLIVVPPGTSHRAVIKDDSAPYRRFVLWLSVDYLEMLVASAPEYGYITGTVVPSGEYVFSFGTVERNYIHSRLSGLLDEVHSDSFGRSAGIQVAIFRLMLYLNRTVYQRKNPKSLTENISHYEALVSYIHEHVADDLSLEKLSEAFYLSKYYIAHLFQENSGLSLHQYIIKLRLSRVKDAVSAGGSITEAALASGFKDYSTFYRAFRKEYGTTPSEVVI